MKNYKLISVLLISLLVFTGCKNSINQEKTADDEAVVLTGTISLPEQSSAQNENVSGLNLSAARSAFPTGITAANLYFSVCLKENSAVVGTVTKSGETATYSIGIPPVSETNTSYTVVVSAYSDSTKIYKVYEGSLSNVVPSALPEDKSIVLNFIKTTSKTAGGTVNLPVVLGSDYNRTRFTATWTSGGTEITREYSFASDTDAQKSADKIVYFKLCTEADETAETPNLAVISGDYEVTFNFYASYSDSKEYLAYRYGTVITVRDNLPTSVWVKNGSDACLSNYTIDGSSVLCLKVDSDLITSYKKNNNCIYVKPDSAETTILGNYYYPYKTLESALTAVKALNNKSGTETYTIYLLSDVTATSTSITNDSYLNLPDDENLKLAIKSYPSTENYKVDAYSLGRVAYAGSGNTLSLYNVTFTGGKSSLNGAGLYINPTASVVLESAVFAADNPVYLDYNTTAGIAALTVDSAKVTISNDYKLSLGSYTDGLQLIKLLSDSTPSFTTEELAHFKIYDAAGTEEQSGYSVSADGTLAVSGGGSGGNSKTALPETIESLSETEYSITTEAQLQALAAYVNSGHNCSGITFYLENSITLTNDWTPIGSYTSASVYAAFSGTFDGQNNQISNMNVSSTSGYQGMFTVLYDATLKNISVSGSVAGGNRIGGIAAYVYGSGDSTSTTIIENCYSNVSISGTASAQYAGGIVGYVSGSSIVIRNCINEAAVSTYTYAAGILGGSSSTAKIYIYNCGNSGAITSTGNYAGGIAGSLNSPDGINIVNVWNSGIITGTNYVSAILSSNTSNSVNASNFNVDYVYYYYPDSTYSNTIIGSNSSSGCAAGTFKNSFALTEDSFVTGTESSDTNSNSVSLITVLNNWITSSTGGNDSDFATYKEWKADSTTHLPVFK